MKLTARKIKKCQIFDIDGPLSIDDAEELEPAILKQVDPEIKKIAINFGNIAYLNSPMLGALVRMHRSFQKTNTTLLLIGSNSELINLFIITGTAQFFTFYKSEEEIPG